MRSTLIILINSQTVNVVVPHPIRLDQHKDGSAIQDYLEEKTGQRTVPNIFIGAPSLLNSS